MLNTVNLSPPYVTIENKINSIGAEPNLEINISRQDSHCNELIITVATLNKVCALAALLKKEYLGIGK